MEELFGDCERFEPDPSAMVDLWNHELEANEREAASPEAILSRYIFFPSSRCQLKSFFSDSTLASKQRNARRPTAMVYQSWCCSTMFAFFSVLVLRQANLTHYQGPNQYGKSHFIGCSKWCAAERWQHRYHPFPSNVDEDVFRYILDNDGRMPDGAQVTVNAQCVLTVHPRLKIKYCHVSFSPTSILL